MKDTLIYSQYCQHCIELINIISKTQFADSLCFLSIDAETEEARAKIREVLFIMNVESVPTLFIHNVKYVGKDAFNVITTFLTKKKPAQPPNYDQHIMFGRNVAKPRMETAPQPSTLLSNQNTGNTNTFVGNANDSNFAMFGEQNDNVVGVGVGETKQQGQVLPELLVPIDTKNDNQKSDELEKRLLEMQALRASMDGATKPPRA
jgi:glutaredoxin